jgi:hypothetical protein
MPAPIEWTEADDLASQPPPPERGAEPPARTAH